ncbi:hypothetical protein Tco_0129424 [Tanacetum coccineum]
MNTSSGIGASAESDDTMNEDTPVGVASAVKEGVTPSLVDMTAEREKISSLKDTTVLGSFPPLSTPVTTTAGNAPGKSSYANITGKPSGKKVNVRTLFTPGSNGIDVVVPVDSIRSISERFAKLLMVFSWGRSEDGLSAIATKLGTPLMPDSYTSDMCLQSWGRSSYARVMIELRADMELKDNIVVAMPKITREGHYTCNVLSTASSSGNKKKGEEPIIEVSNSNPFDVLNSVDNDVEFGTNRGTTNLVNNGATSSGSSFMHVDNSSSDKEDNPLKKVEFPGEDDSEDEVASVDNDMARSLAYERGFGTQSLLEQWRDSYGNGDYDDDPYDDYMYEGQDLSHELQAICDNMDIRVRGRKKK